METEALIELVCGLKAIFSTFLIVQSNAEAALQRQLLAVVAGLYSRRTSEMALITRLVTGVTEDHCSSAAAFSAAFSMIYSQH